MTREEAHNYNVMKNLARKAAAEANKVGAEANHDAGDDGLDFAMLAPPTHPGPCKAATAPEVDPVEKRLERAREAAEHIAAAAEAKALARGAMPCNALSIRNQVRQHEMRKAMADDVCCPDCGHETGYPGRCMSCDWHKSQAVEVRHGSGKVKV